jgi:hypothetical protein
MKRHLWTISVAIISLLSFPEAYAADDDVQALKQQVEQLRRQLDRIEAELRQKTETTPGTTADRQLVQAADEMVAPGEEWSPAQSNVHLAGYGAAGYIDRRSQNSTFRMFTFSPIFHYQYKDLMLLEAEVEMGYTPEGETETNLEYAALDLLVTDSLAVIVGQVLSPIGQFRQNFHPSWINKLPSKPLGFDDGGAAPLTATGVELRGGVNFGTGWSGNYVLFAGNGPRLVDEDGELGVETEGLSNDDNQNKEVGARVGILPMRNLEIGISGAFAKANLPGEANRDYRVFDVDFSYQPGIVDVRGEYVRTRIGALATSAFPTEHTWTAWYVQASHLFAPTGWEPVVRYGRFDLPDGSSEKQTAVGVDYVFSPNVLAKAAYQFNQGDAGTQAADDEFLLQLGYGF